MSPIIMYMWIADREMVVNIDFAVVDGVGVEEGGG